MTYSKWPIFRTGLPVNRTTKINPNALTPTQRMELTRNRIWGNYIGGNERSGFR